MVDARRFQPAVHANGKRLPRLARHVSVQPAQADSLVQCRAEAARRDPADDVEFAVVCGADDLQPLVGHDAGRDHREADQALARLVLLHTADGPLAQEVGLVQFDGQFHVGGHRVGQAVGVLADDEVAFLQPQDALRFDTEGADVKFAAGGQHRFPDVAAVAGRAMDLVG